MNDRTLATVRSRAPLRLGLGGGGTDVSPYSETHGGLVLNATIDKYAYATLEPRTDGRVSFVAADRGLSGVYDPQHLDGDDQLALHKGVYKRIVHQFNGGQALSLTVTTMSDVPPGSGLGSSSTLVVAMVKAFVELLNLPLGEYDVAHLAYEIERIDAGLNGGKQDQYAATFGGFNFMEFGANDRVIVNPLRVKKWIISELESSLMLYHTGVSRESAAIIDEQSARVRSGRQDSVAAMHELKQDAVHMKEALLRGDIQQFASGLGRSWEAKKKMADGISNAGIDAIVRAAMDAGAYSGKVSGAGGGGFVMLMVEPTRRMHVLKALNGFDGEFVGCHFVKHGTEGWRVG
jgi:D-glycero-alpha-D-manno-heptose-7-phosphate kinase